jgi:hypothetical protein
LPAFNQAGLDSLSSGKPPQEPGKSAPAFPKLCLTVLREVSDQPDSIFGAFQSLPAHSDFFHFGPVLTKSPDVFRIMLAKNRLKKSGLNVNSAKSTSFFQEGPVLKTRTANCEEVREADEKTFQNGLQAS